MIDIVHRFKNGKLNVSATARAAGRLQQELLPYNDFLIIASTKRNGSNGSYVDNEPISKCDFEVILAMEAEKYHISNNILKLGCKSLSGVPYTMYVKML